MKTVGLFLLGSSLDRATGGRRIGAKAPDDDQSGALDMGLRGLRLRRGLTLIELMISIAILAIFLAIPMTGLAGSRALTREDDYRWALASARTQKAYLESAAFDSLPPERLTVASDGSVKLSQREVLPATITVDGKPAPTKKIENGKLHLGKERAGEKVVLNYQFVLADQNEAHYLNERGQLVLQNLPAKTVEAAWRADGDRLLPLQPSSTDLKSGTLTFAGAKPGTLVVVDYQGGRWSNRVGSTFLDANLQPTSTPTDTKLLDVQENYGGAWRMSLPLLKVRR